MHEKHEMLSELKRMLQDLLTAKTKGVSYQRLARAHGYVDGYMKALLEANIATQRELLAMVGRRARQHSRPRAGRRVDFRRNSPRQASGPPRVALRPRSRGRRPIDHPAARGREFRSRSRCHSRVDVRLPSPELTRPMRLYSGKGRARSRQISSAPSPKVRISKRRTGPKSRRTSNRCSTNTFERRKRPHDKAKDAMQAQGHSPP